MRKVLLVDDEKYICRGLRAIIERAGTGFGEIYENDDGREALRLISSEHFDLVVLDIRMPNMDGIELLREAQKFSIKPKFVILSGYDDFHYAADCIKYGAKAYLLKPVKREEFIDTLKQVELELLREEELNLSKQKMDVLLNSFRLDELNFIFLKDNLSETEIYNILHTLELNVFDKGFCIGILAARGQCNGFNGEYYARLKMEVSEYYQKTKEEAIALTDLDGNLVLIAARGIDFYELLRFLRKNHEDSYVIGLSPENHTVSQIRKGYLQVREAIKYRILMPSEEIISYTAISHRNSAYKIPLDKIEKILEVIGTSKAAAIDELVDDIFNKEAIQSYHISYFEKTAGLLNEHVIRGFAEYPRKINEQNDISSGFDNIFLFDSIFVYIRRLKDYLRELNGFLLGLKDIYRDKNEIDAAVQYIKSNYAKNLNMTMVANYISLNYSYFSYLFKEQTGLSFVDYLKRLRIEKAKELLQNSDDKIHEIAEKVGYRNPKHFGRVFREVTGVSPVEYRNKALYTASVIPKTFNESRTNL